MHCRVCTNPDVRVTDHIASPNCAEKVPVCFCPECGHYSLFPTQYLQQKSFDWDGIDFYLSDSGRRKQVATRIITRLFQLFERRNNRPPENFLDVGCAIGSSLPVAEQMGLEAIGVEPEKRLAEFGRAEYGVDIRNEKLIEKEAEESAFDLIYCEQVLEHIENPVRFLKIIKSYLNPGGQLYIGVPPAFPLNRFSTHLIRKFNFPLPDTALSNIFHDPDEHISVFSRQSIKRLAQSCQMDIKVLPMGISDLNPRRIIKHLICAGSNPGTFLLTHAKES
jgi:SAM-dependent methyltransferase